MRKTAAPAAPDASLKASASWGPWEGKSSPFGDDGSNGGSVSDYTGRHKSVKFSSSGHVRTINSRNSTSTSNSGRSNGSGRPSTVATAVDNHSSRSYAPEEMSQVYKFDFGAASDGNITPPNEQSDYDYDFVHSNVHDQSFDADEISFDAEDHSFDAEENSPERYTNSAFGADLVEQWSPSQHVKQPPNSASPPPESSWAVSAPALTAASAAAAAAIFKPRSSRGTADSRKKAAAPHAEATPEGKRGGQVPMSPRRKARADSRDETASRNRATVAAIVQREIDESQQASRLEKYFAQRVHKLPNEKWNGWEQVPALIPFQEKAMPANVRKLSKWIDSPARPGRIPTLGEAAEADAAKAEAKAEATAAEYFSNTIATSQSKRLTARRNLEDLLDSMTPSSSPERKGVPRTPTRKARTTTQDERTTTRKERADAAAAQHVLKMAAAREKKAERKKEMYSTSAAYLQRSPRYRERKKETVIDGTVYDKKFKMQHVVLRQFALLQRHIAAAKTIQRAYRRYLGSRCLKRVAAATLFQSVWRGRQQRMEEARWHTAAGLIQIHWRRFVSRRILKVKHASAAFFQQAYASYTGNKSREAAAAAAEAERVAEEERRRYNSVKEAKAAVVLQSAWRGRHVRLWYQTVQAANALEKAAIVVQSAWRGRKVRLWRDQVQAAKTARRTAAAAKIQTWWRAYAAHVHAEQTAAATLQACWRGRRVRIEFAAMRRAAAVIQRAVRAKYGPVLRNRRAAATIQSAWRGRCQRVQYNELRHAAIVLQKVTRGWLERKDARMERVAQRFFAMANDDFLIQSKAATVLQSVWRGKKARKHLKYWNDKATFLQIRIRAWLVVWRTLPLNERVARRTRATMDVLHSRKFGVRQQGKQPGTKRTKSAQTSGSIFARFETVPYLGATIKIVVPATKYATNNIVVPATKYVAKKTVSGVKGTVAGLKVFKELSKDVGPKQAARQVASAAGQKMLGAVKAGGSKMREKIMLLRVAPKVQQRLPKKVQSTIAEQPWKVGAGRLRNEAAHADFEAAARLAAESSDGSEPSPQRPRRVKVAIIPCDGELVRANEFDDVVYDAPTMRTESPTPSRNTLKAAAMDARVASERPSYASKEDDETDCEELDKMFVEAQLKNARRQARLEATEDADPYALQGEPDALLQPKQDRDHDPYANDGPGGSLSSVASFMAVDGVRGSWAEALKEGKEAIDKKAINQVVQAGFINERAAEGPRGLLYVAKAKAPSSSGRKYKSAMVFDDHTDV